MYSVRIREHMMIAHSLPDPFFGPASRLHGATYVVDAEFFSDQLDAHHVVMDIGLAHQVLKRVLEPLNYQNLDENGSFAGKLTTTEYLARYVHDRLVRELGGDFQGRIRVTLHESHVACASYEGPPIGVPDK